MSNITIFLITAVSFVILIGCIYIIRYFVRANDECKNELYRVEDQLHNLKSFVKIAIDQLPEPETRLLMLSASKDDFDTVENSLSKIVYYVALITDSVNQIRTK